MIISPAIKQVIYSLINRTRPVVLALLVGAVVAGLETLISYLDSGQRLNVKDALTITVVSAITYTALRAKHYLIQFLLGELEMAKDEKKKLERTLKEKQEEHRQELRLASLRRERDKMKSEIKPDPKLSLTDIETDD